MNRNVIKYSIITILSLIYLFIFSSRIVILTNLNHTFFNIVSTIIVFVYLDIADKLYFKKYQLKNYEIGFILLSYLAILIYVLFFKNSSTIDSSNLDLIPLFFYSPSTIEFILLVGNIIMFIPIGYFFHRYHLKISLLFILILATAIEGIQYFFKVGVFDVSDILLYVIGFYLGFIFYLFVKRQSQEYNNISLDIRLVFSLILVLCLISMIGYKFLI